MRRYSSKVRFTICIHHIFLFPLISPPSCLTSHLLSPPPPVSRQLPIKIMSTELKSLTNTLTSAPSSWHNSPVLSVSQLTPSGLSLLFSTAQKMRTLVKEKGGDERLKFKILASIFYEASTRTSCSFQAAMLRLGGKVLHIDAGKSGNTSSSKGESLDDTIRCLECYTDITVLRHPIKGSVPSVALGGGTTKPVINAGDGTGEHPTQALLDMFTIWDELKLTIESNDDENQGPLTVVMLGDLKHGRTVHSLAMLLARSADRAVVLRYCSPSSLAMPGYVKEYCAGYDGVKQEECSDLTEAVRGADVLYVTRVQKERFDTAEAYEEVKVCLISKASRVNTPLSALSSIFCNTTREHM